jgi:hypothetical protein
MRRCSYTTGTHVFTLRLSAELWAKLSARAHREQASVNCQITELIEAGLLDSTIEVRRKPEDALPWLVED